MRIDFTPVRVDTDSADKDGYLMLADGALVAVLVRLEGGEHGSLQGALFLEAGFGRCAMVRNETFGGLDGARAWAEARLT